VIVEVIDKLVPGYSTRMNPNDDLVQDLHIDSDDLSFYFVPEVERRLGIHLPADAWSSVARIGEIAAMISAHQRQQH
jgi:acyl carrier protein